MLDRPESAQLERRRLVPLDRPCRFSVALLPLESSVAPDSKFFPDRFAGPPV